MNDCDNCGHGPGMHRDAFEYVGFDSLEKKMVNKCRYLQGVIGGLFSSDAIYCGCLKYERGNRESRPCVEPAKEKP